MAMAYLLEPVNCPYDPEEPMPTPLGFVAEWRFFKGSDGLKRDLKPVPPDLVRQTVDVGGNRPMPDFFFLQANHYYVSSRFRAVLEKYASGAVEYIDLPFNIPANKDPADAYYFINVLGRAQLIDWESTPKRCRRGRYFHWEGPPDRWVMRAPVPNHVAIWHETHRINEDAAYFGSGTHVFVTNELGDALSAAFPGQSRLTRIRETQAVT
jgi:hypothetical protein